MSDAQLGELRGAYETYLRRMGRLIAARTVAYAEVGQLDCPSPAALLVGRPAGTSALGSTAGPSASAVAEGLPAGGPPSLINLARCSSELQRGVELVTGTYRTE